MRTARGARGAGSAVDEDADRQRHFLPRQPVKQVACGEPEFGIAGQFETALEEQSAQMAELLVAGGTDLAIDAYLSAAHGGNSGNGNEISALLPELVEDLTVNRNAAH